MGVEAGQVAKLPLALADVVIAMAIKGTTYGNNRKNS
jgi:hypothetical protein